MSGANGNPADLAIRWSPRAQRSFDQTMAHINSQDPATGELVLQRVQHAIDVIASQPHIGTPTDRPNFRRFPIPKTGHTIEYRLTQDAITIVNWIRQARVRKI